MECLLVSPHRFFSLAFEEAAARAAAITLIAADDDGDFRSRLSKARGVLLTPYARIDADAVAALTACVAIVRYGVGIDNVDLESVTAARIPVANVPDASIEEVAGHSVALALALLRRLPEADRSVRDGAWSSAMMTGARRISDLTVGIVGSGRIGLRAAQMFECLGAKVIVHDQSERPGLECVSLDELIERADVISLHVPLTDETRDLMSSERIRHMRPGAILINVSRGGLVNETALAAALQEGRIGGAGLDVFDTEPLAPGHPLRDAPRVVLTPHIAWRSDESIVDLQRKASDEISYALRGERMPNALNPQVYESAAA